MAELRSGHGGIRFWFRAVGDEPWPGLGPGFRSGRPFRRDRLGGRVASLPEAVLRACSRPRLGVGEQAHPVEQPGE